MRDLFPGTEQSRDAAEPAPTRTSLWIALGIYSLVLVLVTAVTTFAFTGLEGQNHRADDTGSETSASAANTTTNSVRLPFGSQDTVVGTLTVPAGTPRSTQLKFDLTAEGAPISSSRAAMISARVDCRSGGDPVEMLAFGKVSTNVFLAQGGSMSGQALTAETDEELECTLLASAPFITDAGDGLTSMPLHVELSTDSADGVNVAALHWLEDATLFTPGTSKNVLSRKVDDPATLDRMNSTVRLTSCTVVGGSRDGDGANTCREPMTGKESSTVRIQVLARWLDEQGDIASTSTYWDETLAIDYDTHHLPWTLRLADMADAVPEDAVNVVLVVQVESLAGTPFVVHADGTDGVITTHL